MRHIILDTDMGIDDALALFLVLSSPEIKLEAITTVSGNVPVEVGTRNTLTLLELAKRTDIPVARGCDRPLMRQPIHATQIHGDNGLGNAVLNDPHITPVTQHAVEFLIEKIIAERSKITLVCIGPLTNVALALRREPRIAGYIDEVVIMGGALRVPGNVTPAAEYNIYADPHAAHIVLHAGWPIRLVSLDVTNVTVVTPEQIAKLQDNQVIKLIKYMIDYYFHLSAALDNSNGFPMHDPLCVGAVLQPELITWEPAYVDVELASSLTLGATIAQFQNRRMLDALHPNVQASVAAN
ncbi:MAG TPA: nucleoside hydrolase, partial [Ktedonobacteraceae bacterium]|nr:nucleoside hydrolase [Ktedonobacteraceae bacterium]